MTQSTEIMRNFLGALLHLAAVFFYSRHVNVPIPQLLTNEPRVWSIWKMKPDRTESTWVGGEALGKRTAEMLIHLYCVRRRVIDVQIFGKSRAPLNCLVRLFRLSIARRRKQRRRWNI